MNEADYAALSEHLEEVRPVFDAFCIEHGFVYVNRKALGRYPRIRIETPGAVKIWFDLWMGLDANGRRFERFRRDLPYELSARAFVDLTDSSMSGTRFQKPIELFAGKPFDQVGAVLKSEMEKHLPILKKWDLQYLKENGKELHW